MFAPRETPIVTERSSPASKLRTIIEWIMETQRSFRRCQDGIDRLSDRF